ncbi:MAG: pilus motility taxis protein HmpF [Pseudanabaenaceae cyanobacterium]
MQYLAELNKQTGMLNTTVKVRLLAKNVSENTWQAVNDEILNIADPNQAKDLKDGQLVIADINNNKQVQNLQDASRRLVLVLQNFSRLEQKYKQGEEDIEQWKQSLNYQSQELHRRELELEEKEQELENLDIRRQEVESLQAKIEREREELNRWRQELEARHNALAGQSMALDAERAETLRALVRRVQECSPSVRSLKQGIGALFATLERRQETLTGFWQNLDRLRGETHHKERELSDLGGVVQSKRAAWQKAMHSWVEARAQLQGQQLLLQVQENNTAALRQQLQTYETLLAQLGQAMETLGGNTVVLDAEEVARLEAMPIEELAAGIAAYEAEYEKSLNWLNAQEDELAALEGELADLQSQIERANEFERIELESSREFTEEQYKLLEISLVPQRETLRQREGILSAQRDILARRQGVSDTGNLGQLLTPALSQVENQKNHLAKEVQKLESQIAVVRNVIQEQSAALERQQQELVQQKQEWETLEAQWEERKRLVALAWGSVQAQEQMLRPVQDAMDEIRGQLEGLQHALAAVPENALGEVLTELAQQIEALMPA